MATTNFFARCMSLAILPGYAASLYIRLLLFSLNLKISMCDRKLTNDDI